MEMEMEEPQPLLDFASKRVPLVRVPLAQWRDDSPPMATSVLLAAAAERLEAAKALDLKHVRYVSLKELRDFPSPSSPGTVLRDVMDSQDLDDGHEIFVAGPVNDGEVDCCCSDNPAILDEVRYVSLKDLRHPQSPSSPGTVLRYVIHSPRESNYEAFPAGPVNHGEADSRCDEILYQEIAARAAELCGQVCEDTADTDADPAAIDADADAAAAASAAGLLAWGSGDAAEWDDGDSDRQSLDSMDAEGVDLLQLCGHAVTWLCGLFCSGVSEVVQLYVRRSSAVSGPNGTIGSRSINSRAPAHPSSGSRDNVTGEAVPPDIETTVSVPVSTGFPAPHATSASVFSSGQDVQGTNGARGALASSRHTERGTRRRMPAPEKKIWPSLAMPAQRRRSASEGCHHARMADDVTASRQKSKVSPARSQRLPEHMAVPKPLSGPDMAAPKPLNGPDMNSLASMTF